MPLGMNGWIAFFKKVQAMFHIENKVFSPDTDKSKIH